MVSNAQAGSISLYDTSGSSPARIADSLPGYSGQATFNNVVTDGNGTVTARLNLTVDYAVFAPGEISNSPLGMAGQTTGTGTNRTFSIGNFTASANDYVYAYQIFNN